MNSHQASQSAGKVELGWLHGRICRLERRLRHQRDAGRDLPLNSTVRVMNDRAVIEMEVKLFGLKKQLPKR